MVRQGGFYGPAFSVDRGSTIGDPVSPTIFNIVEDAVLRLWFHRIALNLGLSSGTDVVAMFYADDGQVAGFEGQKVQQAFEILMELFRSVGLDLNPRKTKTMTCGPAHFRYRLSSPAFKRRLVGGVESYRARKRRAVECPHCGKQLQERSLPSHLTRFHPEVAAAQHTPTLPQAELEEPASYRVSVPGSLRTSCPVPDCDFSHDVRYNLRRHFAFRHPQHQLVIDEEGPMQRCVVCGMHVGASWRAHPTKLCKQISACLLYTSPSPRDS